MPEIAATNDSDCVLITGGAGFIGSELVRQWLNEESDLVVNYDKLTYAGLEASVEGLEEDPRYTFVQGDVADPQQVAATLHEQLPRTIIHLAAESHVDRSIVEPPLFAQTNVLGTCVMLDAAKNYWQTLPNDRRRDFRFVLISTDEVFGSAQPAEYFTAESPLRPSSPYSASKAAAEHLAQSFARTYGLPINIINSTNNYGPRQLPEKLIPKMILSAFRSIPLTVYGNGLHERDWLHVEDCCRGIRAVVRNGIVGRRYLLGSGRSRTNLEVVNTICEVTDQARSTGSSTRDLIQHIEDRPGHDQRYAVGAPAEELQWEPRTSFDEGIARTVEWYGDNPQWIATARESLQKASTTRS
ncbi:MAG: dTDP-glucose 4,6-dehydratase [Lacipirellulaceae bacterium]